MYSVLLHSKYQGHGCVPFLHSVQWALTAMGLPLPLHSCFKHVIKNSQKFSNNPLLHTNAIHISNSNRPSHFRLASIMVPGPFTIFFHFSIIGGDNIITLVIKKASESLEGFNDSHKSTHRPWSRAAILRLKKGSQPVFHPLISCIMWTVSWSVWKVRFWPLYHLPSRRCQSLSLKSQTQFCWFLHRIVLDWDCYSVPISEDIYESCWRYLFRKAWANRTIIPKRSWSRVSKLLTTHSIAIFVSSPVYCLP